MIVHGFAPVLSPKAAPNPVDVADTNLDRASASPSSYAQVVHCRTLVINERWLLIEDMAKEDSLEKKAERIERKMEDYQDCQLEYGENDQEGTRGGAFHGAEEGQRRVQPRDQMEGQLGQRAAQANLHW